jgi:hypothetical protein
MLEHQKVVLRNVSHDEHLFRKELIKSMAWLSSHELTELRKWLRQHFGSTHKAAIQDILYPVRQRVQ